MSSFLNNFNLNNEIKEILILLIKQLSVTIKWCRSSFAQPVFSRREFLWSQNTTDQKLLTWKSILHWEQSHLTFEKAWQFSAALTLSQWVFKQRALFLAVGRKSLLRPHFSRNFPTEFSIQKQEISRFSFFLTIRTQFQVSLEINIFKAILPDK